MRSWVEDAGLAGAREDGKRCKAEDHDDGDEDNNGGHLHFPLLNLLAIESQVSARP